MTHPLSQFKFCPKCGHDSFQVKDTKSKKCANCGFTYYFNSCGATVALILNSDNELLVATRAHEPAKGTFDLPGGFIDMYETAEEGIRREVKEETGLNILNWKYVFSIPNIYMYSDFEVHTIDLFFMCRVNNNHRVEANDDVEALRFIKFSELQPTQFGLKSIKEAIEKIKSNTDLLFS